MRALRAPDAHTPRRAALAAYDEAAVVEAGIPFEVRPADVEEETAGDPAAVAERNARRKATALFSRPPIPGPAELVLGADTVVALDGRIYGKPADAEQARAYLGALNGRTHEVIGAIALARHGEVLVTAVESTRVTFKASDDAALAAYVATGEWEGRAGGYAIQAAGRRLVERIEGDYLNVVGLPLERLKQLLSRR
ncbi:MAG TPA: nucleoside triphosphate pyrophosphatase [Pyrinomonadaceae bacterium]|nr:nucleoside triphosphate pyrophosphatase [Pyrinomonadaceae bacterium]